jgi:TfoX/Sxy family transcriptional regulator of competence genes
MISCALFGTRRTCHTGGVKFEKSPGWLVELFGALIAEVGGERRQMFGYPCGFESGQLFTGLFGDSLFVRLGEAERARLLDERGAKPFDPMGGRPMREYAVVPQAWLEDEELIKQWMERAREYARTLPPKGGKAKKAARKRR